MTWMATRSNFGSPFPKNPKAIPLEGQPPILCDDGHEVRTVNDYEEAILQLVEYELWANFKLLKFIEGISEEERNRDFGFGLRTPHKTIVHIAKVMQG